MLQRHFLHAFPGWIWKICPDHETGNLVLELRQKETLQTSFTIVNAHSGLALVKDLFASERWWTGMEAACHGNLLLHGYSQDRETGRHLGIFAVSEQDGTPIWQQPALTYKGLYSGEIVVAENSSGQMLALELGTGAVMEVFTETEPAKEKIRAFEQERSKDMQFPVPYLPADEYYSLLQEFLYRKTGKTAQQQIEYLESGSYIILSFYAPADTVLANYLVVCSAAGEVLLEICLESEVAGIGLDTFFIFAAKLFFIQEKSSLGCYLL